MSVPLFHNSLKLILVFNCITESLKVKIRSVGGNPVYGPSITTLSENFLGVQFWDFVFVFVFCLGHFE